MPAEAPRLCPLQVRILGLSPPHPRHFLFFQHIRHTSASEVLPRLFPLPRMLFPHSVTLSLQSLGGFRLSEAFLYLPVGNCRPPPGTPQPLTAVCCCVFLRETITLKKSFALFTISLPTECQFHKGRSFCRFCFLLLHLEQCLTQRGPRACVLNKSLEQLAPRGLGQDLCGVCF